MAEPEDSLVIRRSRRSTAGNRMEAALAEMALDNTAEAMEDDQDFVNDKDEEDVFGSDFESTDEEAAQEDLDAGDKTVQEEERRARKSARSRVEKATAAAHEKHKVTFNPQAEASASTSKLKVQRRVSLGVAVNAETGEILPADKSSPKKKRHSQRKHTVLNTSATVTRMKRSEEKKAATPKKVKTESRTFTQAELIALALDNEEGNIVDHRDYLKIEEEKRRRARVVRAAVDGPLIRWISKGEEIKVIVPPPPVPTFVPTRAPYAYAPYNASGPTVYGQTPYTYSAGVFPHMASGGYVGVAGNYTSSAPTAQVAYQSTSQTSYPASQSTSQPTTQPITQVASQPAAQSASPSAVQAGPQSTTQSALQSMAQPLSQPPTQTMQYQPTNYNPYMAQFQSTAPGTLPVWTPPPPPQPTERIEKVAKNYVVHELAQEDGVSKPAWNETMAAMFGDHVKWDELKVYVGKGRPLSRPKQTCPITGKQAIYLDPRTGVPYADLRAYEVLTRILNHEFLWSPRLGCYVGEDERRGSAIVSGTSS
ncbi:YL1 nuclear protein-domain-containing protein [Lyophyllum atratum]|nr:YL1 nuclear protein-domain-containing protein [Lyophyllum atratum]